jgi:hypothetical protein
LRGSIVSRKQGSECSFWAQPFGNSTLTPVFCESETFSCARLISYVPFFQDYGQAGAIDFFRRSAGLPPAMSGDRTYFLWGPRGYSGDCMIVLDDRKEVLERYWQNVEYVGSSAPNPWALETEIPVFICRTKKFASWAEVWPGLKRWR